jgi:hypothetical protein
MRGLEEKLKAIKEGLECRYMLRYTNQLRLLTQKQGVRVAVQVTERAVESAATITGITASIAAWQQYITPVAGLGGIFLTFATSLYWLRKMRNEAEKLKIEKKESDERIKIEIEKAQSEIRLNSSREYAIEHRDRRKCDLTPEQCLERLKNESKNNTNY